MTDRPTTQAALDARFGDAPRVPPEAEILADMAGRGVCRLYAEKPVDPALVRTLCGIALSAPSKSDLQQRDIVVVTRPGDTGRDGPDHRVRLAACGTGAAGLLRQSSAHARLSFPRPGSR